MVGFVSINISGKLSYASECSNSALSFSQSILLFVFTVLQKIPYLIPHSKDEEGSCRDLSQDTIPAVKWRDLGKP
jgi:hypothetical protein